MNATELTDRQQAILIFERQWWKFAGAKEAAVREQFDMTATRYYQVVNATSPPANWSSAPEVGPPPSLSRRCMRLCRPDRHQQI
jgi:hypothetical protein